jgi:hypothetical protein
MEKNDNKKKSPDETKQAQVRGKEAIDAEKKAAAADPASAEVKKKEQKDAERWRNSE